MRLGRGREEIAVMAVAGEFDFHRRQLTFDYLDTVTGEVARGRISAACWGVLHAGLTGRFAGTTA